MTRAPREPGTYILAVEPTADPDGHPFLREGAWRNNTSVESYLGIWAIPFAVVGGIYLDEDYNVILDTIRVSDLQTVHVKAELPTTAACVSVDVVYSEDDVVVSTTTVTLDRVGLASGTFGVYLGQIDLVAAARLKRGMLGRREAGSGRKLPSIVVGDQGMLTTKWQDVPIVQEDTATFMGQTRLRELVVAAGNRRRGQGEGEVGQVFGRSR